MESQLMGLYPQEDIYFSEILLPTGAKQTTLTGKSPLIPIYLNQNKIEPMLLIEDYCKPYKDDVKLRKSTSDYLKLFEKYPEITKVVENYFNSTPENPAPDFLRVLGSVTSNSFMGYPVPSVFNNKWLKNAQKLYIEIRKYLRYGTEYSRKLAASEFLNTILDQFESKIKGKGNLKATLYSAHDTTLMNIFTTLKLPISIQPPFASILIFELHELDEKFYVKILYNNEPVTLSGCSSDFCEFFKFKSFIEASTFKNATDACLGFTSSVISSNKIPLGLPGDTVDINKIVVNQSGEEESNSVFFISFFTIPVLILLYYLIKKIPR
jgi:hypothetical protein